MAYISRWDWNPLWWCVIILISLNVTRMNMKFIIHFTVSAHRLNLSKEHSTDRDHLRFGCNIISGHRFCIVSCSFVLLLFGRLYLVGARTWKLFKEENYILVSAGNNVMNSSVQVIGTLILKFVFFTCFWFV